MITLKIEACGKKSELRVLTPRAFTKNYSNVYGHRRATWQIDYVKHIVLSFVYNVSLMCFEDNQDPAIEVDYGELVKLLNRVKTRLRERYTTRKGGNLVESIRESHLKKALKELRRELEKERFETLCRKYLVYLTLS